MTLRELETTNLRATHHEWAPYSHKLGFSWVHQPYCPPPLMIRRRTGSGLKFVLPPQDHTSPFNAICPSHPMGEMQESLKRGTKGHLLACGEEGGCSRIRLNHRFLV